MVFFPAASSYKSPEELEQRLKDCNQTKGQFNSDKNICEIKRDQYKGERDTCKTEQGVIEGERDKCLKKLAAVYNLISSSAP